ncbi:MAG: Flp pilus assembly complex ATPase component TadA [Planctomycetes bacterium]|nr:Flp pilus assembly complex ATPase component TadA [Planctomycetota bacterium]
MSTFDKKIRSILAQKTELSEDLLEGALQQALAGEKSLADVLLEKGEIDEKELLGLISLESGLPPVDLEQVTVDENLLTLIPQKTSEDYMIFPVTKLGNILTIAVVNPFDILKMDNVCIFTRCELRPVVASERGMRAIIKKGYCTDEEKMAQIFDHVDDVDVELNESNADTDELELDVSNEGSPVVRLVNMIIANAIRDGVSDIHIEPYEKKIKVRYRQDGLLKEVMSPPKAMQNPIVSRIKIMASLDIAEKRKPQDGKFQVKLDRKQVDFRVSILPVVHGEKVVLRLLDISNLTLNLESLGFEQKALDDYRHSIAQPYGMILITGPTGSGKSTTLYSAVKEIWSPEINLVTVEDPVEYQLDGINQVPVNPKRGLTFAGALRSILRQDPDVILIGEIRDTETVEIAVKAALTGHLVLSTLHTNDAASTVTRMVDMGLDPFMVASSVLIVAAQRLARVLCPNCKERVEIPLDRLISIGFSEEEAREAEIHKAVGCSRCSGGYKGRFALLETLPITERVKRLIIEGKSAVDIKQAAMEEDMLTLRKCGILNAMRGKTSLEEILRVTMADDQ